MQFDRTALILGLMIFYVAYQQWQTNERKRKQDLFGKDIQEHIINLFEQKINTYDEFTKPFEKYLCLKSVSKNLINKIAQSILFFLLKIVGKGIIVQIHFAYINGIGKFQNRETVAVLLGIHKV